MINVLPIRGLFAQTAVQMVIAAVPLPARIQLSVLTEGKITFRGQISVRFGKRKNK